MTDVPPQPDAGPEAPAPASDETSSTATEHPRPRWSRRRHAITWSVLGAGVVLLAAAGVTIAFAAMNSSSHEIANPVESEETPLDPPSASPSVPIQVPLSAVPLGCGDLISPASLSTLLGPTAAVNLDESTPSFGDDAMMRQAGILLCAWATDDGSSLFVAVAPDGASIYEDHVRPHNEVPSAYTWIDTVGDSSVIMCNQYETVFCSGYLLLGDYFVEAHWRSPLDEDYSRQLTEDLIGKLAGQIRSAGPEREVVMPTGSGSAAEWLCSPPALTAASAAFGVEVFAGGGDAGSPSFWSSHGTTRASLCLWGGDGLADAIRPIGLPGGAWALEQWRRERPDAVIVGLAGDGDGVVECGATACFALAEVDGDLLALEAPVYGEAEFRQIARDFFAAVP